MRKVIKNQAEYDAISMDFCGEIIIDSSPEQYFAIARTPPKASVKITGKSRINYVCNSATIDHVCNSATIKNVCNSATIDYVYNSAMINSVHGSATIKNVCGSATIEKVYDSATIERVYDSATIKNVYDSATIKNVYDSATINYVCDSATIDHVFGAATIDYVYGSAIVIGNPDRVQNILGGGQVIQRITNYSYTVDDFVKIENIETDGDFLFLYKSVDPDTMCDFWTGKIKYEGNVVCPDFDPDPSRQCGGGLHLSPTPEGARSYNQGKILKCKVHKDDVVIYSNDLSKVRCRKVEVYGEVG